MKQDKTRSPDSIMQGSYTHSELHENDGGTTVY